MPPRQPPQRPPPHLSLPAPRRRRAAADTAAPTLQVLLELGANEMVERFRLEYETLYRALKKSHESEKRLMKKCKARACRA